MNIAIVVAGGIGSRVSGLNMPKQFAVVNGKKIMEHTLSVFAGCKLIDKIILVTNEQYLEETKQVIKNIDKPVSIVVGGSTRQQSVYNALTSENFKPDDIVLIHDCARPLVDEEIIERNIEEAKRCGTAITAIKVQDSVMRKDESNSISYEDREKLYKVQTPQTFKYDLISKAHKKALNDGINDSTDDGQLLKRMGIELRLVEGKNENFKITTDIDLLLFEQIINKKKA